MGRQRERDEFISIMAAEGVPLDVTRKLLSAGATLHRLAELECSSEAADRDQVPCPESGKGRPREGKTGRASACLCRDYGSYSDEPRRCPKCAGLGHGLAPDERKCRKCLGTGQLPAGHGTVPRIAVQGQRLEARVRKLCAAHGLEPKFGGDPRGAALVVKVPSGKTNDWGQTGVCVP